MSETVKIKHNKIRERLCAHCNKPFTIKHATQVFCSKSCSNRMCIRKHKGNKEVFSIKKQHNRKIFKCKWDGSILQNRISPNKKYIQRINTLKALGINTTLLGTKDIWREYERVKNVCVTDYVVNQLSLNDLSRKYNIRNITTIKNMLVQMFGVTMRLQPESMHIAYMHGKIHNHNKVLHFKTGWHTTFYGKQVYYRSSYELAYIKKLDQDKVDYDMESHRIKYFDSVCSKYRVAIPDIHIINTNKLIEIKSTWTLNIINMYDKFKSYINQGFAPCLVLEGVEYTYDNFVTKFINK